MIKPSIGRVVLFHPSKKSELVYDAHICSVHNDALINVGGFDNNGNAYGATSVALLQEGDEAPNFGAYATWMPYQIDQSAKTEALKKQMKEFIAPPDDEMKPVPGMVPGILGSSGVVIAEDSVERITIGPSELDDLMAGSVAPGMAVPSEDGTETKE